MFSNFKNKDFGSDMSFVFFGYWLQGLNATPSKPGNGTVEGGLELPSSEVLVI